MYTLILRCRDAVKQGSTPWRFRKWVTSEVLPQIRKTGKYQPQPEPQALPKVGDYWLTIGKDGKPNVVPLGKDQIITNPSNIMSLRSMLALIPTCQLHEFMKYCTDEVINRAKGMLDDAKTIRAVALENQKEAVPATPKASRRDWKDAAKVEQEMKSMRLKLEEMYEFDLIKPDCVEELHKQGVVGPRQIVRLRQMMV